ncbi:MAG: ferredoxin-type protein NapF [Geminicoccaceae bacterium]
MPSSRRTLLTGRRSRPDAVYRPPFASAAFAELCRDCDQCVEACPEGIVRLDESGWAMLDLAEGGCTFCGDCARACPTGALGGTANWSWRAEIGGSCLALKGVLCELCSDGCDVRAIRMRPVIGGRRLPLLDRELCTGCGACLGRCPEKAIRLTRIEEIAA